MAATFRPVNPQAVPELPRIDPILAPASTSSSPPTSSSPHPTSAAASSPQPPSPTMEDDATTPTRATFNASIAAAERKADDGKPGALAGQRPLPTSPFPQAIQIPDATTETSTVSADKKATPRRGNSQRSDKSKNSEDIDMEDGSDGDTLTQDDNAASDDSGTADGKSNSKKKKGQRFYCLEYPPCNLSFTRSEHLARHIRKHTGERPFQCHCSRRFSRLDNLRQHAQTVHVNEDIPMDSLAATGARFRGPTVRAAERVRPTAGRPRAATASSVGAARGHSKSLSTSSINSITSTVSTRDRPPPLVMADPRPPLPLEPYSATRDPRDSGYAQYRGASPSDFSTPTSATFSTAGQDSPRWGSGFASPTSSHSRSQSMYDSRTSNRRLSVPMGNNPFQVPPLGAAHGRPNFGPGSPNVSNSGAFPSVGSSLVTSPTLPGSGSYSRRDSISSNASNDDSWRRRTWHPDSQNFHPTRLSAVSTPNQYEPTQSPPLANPSSQSTSSIRLPGIESFDPIPRRPASPPKRNLSPMMIDSNPRNPPPYSNASSLAESRRGVSQWDLGLHRGLTRLEIASPTGIGSGDAPNGGNGNHNSNKSVGGSSSNARDSAHNWAAEANQAVQAQAEQVRRNLPTVRFSEANPPSYSAGNAPVGPRSLHQHTMSAPSASAVRDRRRHGWVHSPMQTHVEETRTSRIERMVHPNMANGFTGFPARDSRPDQAPQGNERTEHPERLRGLDALVAVATSEGGAAAAY